MVHRFDHGAKHCAGVTPSSRRNTATKALVVWYPIRRNDRHTRPGREQLSVLRTRKRVRHRPRPLPASATNSRDKVR